MATPQARQAQRLRRILVQLRLAHHGAVEGGITYGPLVRELEAAIRHTVAALATLEPPPPRRQ